MGDSRQRPPAPVCHVTHITTEGVCRPNTTREGSLSVSKPTRRGTCLGRPGWEGGKSGKKAYNLSAQGTANVQTTTKPSCRCPTNPTKFNLKLSECLINHKNKLYRNPRRWNECKEGNYDKEENRVYRERENAHLPEQDVDDREPGQLPVWGMCRRQRQRQCQLQAVGANACPPAQSLSNPMENMRMPTEMPK